MPRAMRAFAVVVAVVTATGALEGEATAGVQSPLSAVPSLPKLKPSATVGTPGVASDVLPGVRLKASNAAGASRWLELSAAKKSGYCFEPSQNNLSWTATTGATAGSPSQELTLVRLVETTDGHATFERTQVHFDPASASLTAMGRTSVELKEVARSAAGIAVWAFRSGNQITVLARDVEMTAEVLPAGTADDRPTVFGSDCGFGGARLDVSKPENGAVAQLAGTLPRGGKGKDAVRARFVVDVSVSRVSVDPEAMLAVRIRMRDS